MVKTVQVSLDEHIAEQLEQESAAPDEVIKLGLEALARRRELAAQEAWADSLPELELSDEERRELTEAMKEADAGLTRPMSVEEIMAAARSD